MDGFHSILKMAGKKISKLKNRSREIIQSKGKRKRLKGNEETLKDQQNNIKCSKTHTNEIKRQLEGQKNICRNHGYKSLKL